MFIMSTVRYTPEDLIQNYDDFDGLSIRHLPVEFRIVAKFTLPLLRGLAFIAGSGDAVKPLTPDEIVRGQSEVKLMQDDVWASLSPAEQESFIKDASALRLRAIINPKM